jgi:hypothetical protein
MCSLVGSVDLHCSKAGRGLCLDKEILGMTSVTIIEIGEEGRGARFEIRVPKEGYRFKNETA